MTSTVQSVAMPQLGWIFELTKVCDHVNQNDACNVYRIKGLIKTPLYIFVSNRVMSVSTLTYCGHPPLM